MKKTYIAPSAEIQTVELENRVALLVNSNPTGGSEGAVIDAKEEGDWNIWSED